MQRTDVHSLPTYWFLVRQYIAARKLRRRCYDSTGTVLRKTSECFVQWRDLEKGDTLNIALTVLTLHFHHLHTRDAGGAWGLNFASESDITRFLAGCTVRPGGGHFV